MKKSLLNSIARYISRDGELFIQSDIYKLIESMTNVIDSSNYFDRKEILGVKWLNKNPYEAFTDRELFVLKQKLPIFRAMYIRNSKSS